MLFTKYNINISLYPQSKKGKQFVRIRVSAQSSRVDLYTGISLNNSQWDKKKQQVKQGCLVNNVTYNILNNTLEEYKRFIQEYFTSCAMRDTRPSLSELQERFNRQYKMSSEAQSDEFFYLFDKFIEEKSKERGWGRDMKDVYDYLKTIPHKSPLTKEDMKSALKAWKKDFYNLRLHDIERLTEVRIPRNKRNGRKQEVHLERARAVQMIDYPNGEWRNKDGRPQGSSRQRLIVEQWQTAHPDGRKSDCIRETGLSKPTVYRWWQ